MQFLLIAGGLVAAYVLSSLRVLTQYERGVVFFLGRYTGTRGPGLLFVPSILARMKRVSIRVFVLDIPPQDVITRDNISVKVNAVLYFRVMDPSLAVIEVQDYLYATTQLAQTTLLSVLGQVELDELLVDRRKVNDILKQIIDERTEPWGIRVISVEVRDVRIPLELQSAMSRQAQAERERQARIILGTAETEIASKFVEAAEKYQQNPVAMNLRAMNMLYESIVKRGSLMVVPSGLADSLNLPGIMGLAGAAGAKVPPPPREGDAPAEGEDAAAEHLAGILAH